MLSFADLSSRTYFSFVYVLFDFFLFLWIKCFEIKLQAFKQSISIFCMSWALEQNP